MISREQELYIQLTKQSTNLRISKQVEQLGKKVKVQKKSSTKQIMAYNQYNIYLCTN